MSSAASSSPPFIEGLEYSCDAAGRRNTYGSLARRVQELGAELCSRLSQAALRQHTPAPSAHPLMSGEVAQALTLDVQRDLSAHYGSHALRRGLAKPFGPCVRPVLRKGNFAVAQGGVHGPRSMRLWRLRRAHRCWCPSCGVWLTRGGRQSQGSAGGDGVGIGGDLCSTVVECRVRGHGRHTPHLPSTKKYNLCCVHCLTKEHRTAARAAGTLQGDVAAADSPQKTAAVKKKKSAKAAIAARDQQRRQTHAKLRAVVAAARLPRRNRRCRRRSARRPRKAARATAKVVAANHRPAAETVRVQTALAASLATPAAPKGAGSGPAEVSKAQRSLQGLVPSGPLKKLGNAARPKGSVSAPSKTPEARGRASDLCAPSPRSTTAASSHVTPGHGTLPSADPPPPAPQHKQQPARPAEAPTPAHTPSTAARVLQPATVPSAASALTAHVPAKPSSTVALAKTGVSGSAVATAAKATPPLPVAKAPPARAMAKKAVKQPPGKGPSKTSGKAKLMDTMSQLGF